MPNYEKAFIAMLNLIGSLEIEMQPALYTEESDKTPVAVWDMKYHQEVMDALSENERAEPDYYQPDFYIITDEKGERTRRSGSYFYVRSEAEAEKIIRDWFEKFPKSTDLSYNIVDGKTGRTIRTVGRGLRNA